MRRLHVLKSILVRTHADKILLTYLVFVVIALVTGVIVNYYNQLIQIRQKDTLASFSDRLQRLPELSKEELEEMSANAKEFFQNRNGK